MVITSFFTKLPKSGGSEKTFAVFESSCHLSTGQALVKQSRWRLSLSLNAKRQAGKLWILVFITFGLT